MGNTSRIGVLTSTLNISYRKTAVASASLDTCMYNISYLTVNATKYDWLNLAFHVFQSYMKSKFYLLKYLLIE